MGKVFLVYKKEMGNIFLVYKKEMGNISIKVQTYIYRCCPRLTLNKYMADKERW